MARIETYAGLLKIPEAKVGTFEIKHMIQPAGKLMPCTSFRTAMYGGHKAKSVVYDVPTTWHELLEDGSRWTSDLPIEQYQQRQSIRGFRGRVLIGGLGLGVVVNMLTRLRSVTQIDVVELSPEVIELVMPYVGDERTRIINADLSVYLKSYQGPQYHHAFFDTWTSDGEGTFYEEVLPLRRDARPIVKGKIECWNEDIMRGQVAQSLMGPLQRFQFDAQIPPTMSDGTPVPRMSTLSNGKPLTLEWLATENESVWHNRSVVFYKTLLDVNPDFSDTFIQQRCSFLASCWARNYDGTPEFLECWAQFNGQEKWEFSELYCRQLAEHHAA